MYWKEIPIQVQAEYDTKTVSIPLDDRFQRAADAISMMDGSAGTAGRRVYLLPDWL